MWREEVGITEMMLAYIGEFVEFQGWSSWKNVVIDILSCHEEMRRQRITCVSDEIVNEDVKKHFEPTAFTKSEPIMDSIELTVDIQAQSNEHSTSHPENDVDNISEHSMIIGNSSGSSNLKRATGGDQDSSGALPMEHMKEELDEDGMHTFYLDESEFKATDTMEISSDYGIVREELVNKEEISYEKDNEVDSLNSQEIILPTPSDKCNSRIGDVNNDVTQISAISSSNRKQVLPNKETVHSVGKNHHCSFCEKTFVRSSEKRRHERIHTGEKPYSCSYCGRSFTQVNHKLSHELIHRRERPYSCGYCPRSFSRNEDKKTHERSHTGEKPFSCTICFKSLSSLRQKRSHERIHTEDIMKFACNICGKRFRQHARMLTHERTHSSTSLLPLQ